jgi:hypothetical protein
MESRTSRTNAVSLIGFAVVGTLVALNAVSSSVPPKTELIQVSIDAADSSLVQQYKIWKNSHSYNFEL